MIDLRNITVRFRNDGKDFDAVKDASVTVEKGEIFGIVGSSGAGKSTLLRTINLLERPTAGRVVLDGEDITDLRGKNLRLKRQKIGMIFQHFNLMHTRTVSENVAFALSVAKVPAGKIRERVPEILELVGLSDKHNAYPAQLSGGQKQRVGIARALANRPELLLCDEPTSALDLETSASILELLAEINRKLGITVVIISHEMAVIKAICSRVAVMDRGTIVESGPIYDIFADPKDPFTRQLVERTFNLEIPERHLQGVEGTLLKVLFRGNRAEEPVLSESANLFAVSINILHGKIEYIAGQPLGLLVVALSGDRESVRKAVDHIRANTAKVEVLHV